MDSMFIEEDLATGSKQAYAEVNYQGISFHRVPKPDSYVEDYIPIARIVSFSPLKKSYNRAVKRSFDVVLSVMLIIGLLSWIIPLFAILIKLDSRGPVFFRQKRNRKGGELFSCIKFRTMIVNEEADTVAAKKDDYRITRFGNFLRHYHLDELPQLFNVLMGDMSIIGPRPYMVNENLYYENLVEAYSQRHTIKPGITGLAQSFGYFGSFHDINKVRERVSLDIQYIQQWSVGMDIRILCRTLMMVFGPHYDEDHTNLPA